METIRIQLVNPLPVALHHYESALTASTPGVAWDRTLAGGGVEGAGSLPARGAAWFRHLHHLQPDLAALLLWPGFGHLESVSLGRRQASTALVVHDPTPLRRQFGYGTLSVKAGAFTASRRGLVIVAHSGRAASVLRVQGYRNVMRLPHPIVSRTAASSAPPGSSTVRVLGQYKHARDLDLLAALGPPLRLLGFDTEILGRGWPEVSGWTTHSAFLDEVRFDEVVKTSAAVVLPYRNYYQSGVAVRALEHAVPVVGPAGGFLAELFGPTWCGLLATDASAQDWVEAVVAASAARGDCVEICRQTVAATGRTWVDFVGELQGRG